MVLQTERYPGGYQQQSYSTYQGPTGGYSSYQGVSEYTSPHSGPYQASAYPSGYGPHHPSGWCNDDDYYGNGASHYAGGRIPAPVKPKFDGYGSSYYENSYKHESSYNHGHGSPPHHGHGSPPHHGHGSPPHHGHGSPPHHGHDSPPHHGHGHGSQIGFGGAITSQINKLKPKHNNYENPYAHENSHHHGHGGSHNLGHSSPTGYGKTHGFGSAIKNQINKLTDGYNNYGSGSPNYGHGPSGPNHGYQQHTWVQKGLSPDE